MKKIKVILLVLCMLSVTEQLFADPEYDLTNVPKDYIGTYMPVAFEMQLNATMSYEKALHTISPTNYDILMLRENICYTSAGFTDGYAVKAKDFAKWSFVERGTDKFILDENGCSYRKISDDASYSGYEVFGGYALSVIFQDAIHNKNISIKDDTVTIYGKSYSILLWPSYSSETYALYLKDDKDVYFLVLDKNDPGAKIVKGKDGEYKMVEELSDEVVQEIPLFYWSDKTYPDCRHFFNMANKDSRLMKSIIYAKHGYSFKDDNDLREIFEQFDWYKVNPDFSEADFSNYEKRVINDKN